MQFSFAQEKTVTGVVSDKLGPLPGANVVVKGTTNGTQTDFDGKFSIKAKTGDVLEVSFTGFAKTTIVVSAASNYKVVMSEGSVNLDEVVIQQGYRTVTKQSAVTSVATVTSKTIENRPNANVMNTLQGQLAGVNIVASSGQPGAKSTVIIRGLGSINGNTDPLYVIDGFPSNSDNFRSINPNDIASVDVLKDAAATAEYGSRGSNGVIVIRTKKGSFGDSKTIFRYTSQIGLTELQTPKYKYANAKELLRIEKNFGAGRGATLTDAEIDAYDIDTDWVNYFFNVGTSSMHNLSIENNAKNFNSFTSVSYFDQEGVLKTTGLKRFTLRNNLSGKSENDKFKYSVNTGFGFSKNNEATNLGGGAVNRNYVLGAYISAPYISPAEYQNPAQLLALYQGNGTLLYTPLMLVDKLNTYVNETQETRINVATEASYKLTNDLTARTRTSAELLSTRFNQSEHPVSFNALLFLAAGQTFGGFEDINQRREFLFNHLWQLDYQKTIGKHSFNVMLNSEYNNSRVQTNNFRQRGLDPKFFVPGAGSGYIGDTAANDFHVPTISASHFRVDLISYFATLEYDFAKKYGVVGTVRRDGASRFIGDNQFNNFWSVGARWNIDKEDFMKSADFIDVLKLRGSYGTVGNQRIVDGTIYAGIIPPAFADIYSITNNTYNSGQGYGISFGYPDLRWETTEQHNIGIDFEMFKSRLRGTFDQYQRKTIDLFLAEPVSPSVGTTSITKNSDAYVTNSGYELSLGYDIVRSKDMTLTIRGNGAYNKNEVGGIKINNGQIIVGTVPTYITQNGGTINEPYVYPYLGVNPLNGNLLFQDINGNPTEAPTAADRVATGKNRIPVYQGGFGFDFDYKGFFTSASFTFAQDVWRFDWDQENLYDPTNLGQFTVGSDLLNAWTPTNTTSNIPALNAANLALDGQSDRWLTDASYIRLRNLQVGYKLPKKFLEKSFINEISITLQGENLFNITKWQGFDPESDRTADVYQYPTPRLYTFSLDIKF